MADSPTGNLAGWLLSEAIRHGERRYAEAADEIDRLRAALTDLDAMYRRIAPDDPEGLHPDLHPAWKACKAALRAQEVPHGK